MDNPQTAVIAITPPAAVDADLIKDVSIIIDKDLYGTQLLLAGKTPRIIAHYQNPPEAEPIAERLRNRGLVVIVIRDSDLIKTSAPIFKAHVMRFGQDEMVFQDKSGATRTIKTESVFLILKGMRQNYTEKEITKNRRKLNLPATLLTGGIPITRKVQEKTTETTFQSEYFLRLYHRNSAEPDIETNQYDFDYSCLGISMSATSLVNFGTLAVKIQGLCPQAIFDDTLAKSSTANPDNVDINCRLTYLFRETAIDSDAP